MPGITPIYGFTYPCPGEAISPATIALLTGQIDAKMSDVDADWFYMLNRYNTEVPGVTQNIPNGVETVLLAPTYTFPVAGVWQVTAAVIPFGGPATINMFRARLRINATARFGITANTQNFVLNTPRPQAPMVAAAGDVASITCIYNGSGTMDVQGRLAAKLVCRIA
jgi:hypothetical protein